MVQKALNELTSGPLGTQILGHSSDCIGWRAVDFSINSIPIGEDKFYSHGVIFGGRVACGLIFGTHLDVMCAKKCVWALYYSPLLQLWCLSVISIVRNELYQQSI